MKDAIIKAPFVRRTTSHFTLGEEKLIEAAEEPLWQPISEELLMETRARIEQNRKVLIQGVVLALFVMGGALLLGAKQYAFAIGITAAVFAVAAVITHLRTKIDESAVMLELPLEKIVSSITGSYAVCYLPDGRYEFRVTGDNSYANTLMVVKYKHMTTWQAVFIRRADDVPLPSTLGLDSDDLPETEDSAAAASEDKAEEA